MLESEIMGISFCSLTFIHFYNCLSFSIRIQPFRLVDFYRNKQPQDKAITIKLLFFYINVYKILTKAPEIEK